MLLKLDPKWTEELRRLPESGMGYQRVRLRLKDGRLIPDAVVLNADVLDIPAPATSFCAEDIQELIFDSPGGELPR